MRKIILWMSVSIDGYMQGPDGELDWQLVDDELHQHFNDDLRAMGGFLDGGDLRADGRVLAHGGRRSREQRALGEFAGIWRDMPKLVFSRTLQHAHWNTTIVRDVVPDEIRTLKAEPGGDLVLGGADLAATFLRHRLVDEYRLYVHPVVLGRGKPPSHGRRPRLRWT
jgi:dihydrofolate reductase